MRPPSDTTNKIFRPNPPINQNMLTARRAICISFTRRAFPHCINRRNRMEAGIFHFNLCTEPSLGDSSQLKKVVNSRAGHDAKREETFDDLIQQIRCVSWKF
jgi:hypothetical protein